MEAKEHLTVDDCLKLYEEEGIMGLVEKVKETSFKAGIKEVVELVRDWDTLHGNDFDAKYGIHQDGFGFQKSLPEVIVLYFGIGKPN